MSIIKKMRRGGAWYWKVSGYKSDGSEVYDAPILIPVRWEKKIVEYVDRNGEKKLSTSVVYVDRETIPGDMLQDIPGRLWKRNRRMRPGKQVFYGLNQYIVTGDGGKAGNTPPTHTTGTQTIDFIEYEFVQSAMPVKKKKVERIDGIERLPTLRYNETLHIVYV